MRILSDRRGAALVEFALLVPLLLVLLLGMLGFGQYLLVAHTLQQVANDAARASIAGITATERATLARARVASGLRAMDFVKPEVVTSAIVEADGHLTVTLAADTRTLELLRASMVPMPDPVIERRGVAMLAGVP